MKKRTLLKKADRTKAAIIRYLNQKPQPINKIAELRMYLSKLIISNRLDGCSYKKCFTHDQMQEIQSRKKPLGINQLSLFK